MKSAYPVKRLLSIMILGAVGAFSAPVSPVFAQPAVATPSAALPDFTDLVDKVGPAVVNIRTTERSKMGAQGSGGFPPGMDDPEMQEFFRRFFGVPVPRQQPETPRGRRQTPQQQQEEEVPRGVGSGFIISPDGYVLTNAHVVEGADEVYVTLTDKREYKAKIIGSDKRTDVALVKIEGSNLPRLNFGDSNKVRVGEWVIAIGSPFGLDNTVTAGIISAKARDTGDYLPLIQTDVAVNPGNSGGPLINMRGEVIGINSQIYSRSGGYMGISFAVPIDEAIRVSEQLKTTGRVTRGRIGVQIGEVTKDVADSLGLPKANGALVQRVEQGGPAEKGGIEPGDIIVKFNGMPIEKSSDLPRMVGNTKPGARSTVTVWRKGAARDLAINIGEMEPDNKVAKEEARKPKPEQAVNTLGLAVTDLSETQKRELKIDGGAVIENAEGAAARAGLRPGDIVLRINNTDVKDGKQFNALVSKLEPKKTVLLLVRRGEASQFVTIKPNGQ
ncbi:DegQ family serine endoprotease|nr:DegQ family serine endoprotease [Noviherbaspirillum sp. L7-7A]